MNDNRISDCRLITPADIDPVVQIANYIDVPAGRRYGWRTIPDLELILVVAGEFRYERRGAESVPVRPGQVLCILPAQEHVFRHDGVGDHGVISCIHCEMVPGASWASEDYRLDPAPLPVVDIRGRPILHDLFRRCAEEYRGYARYRGTLVRCMACEILVRLSDLWASGPQAGSSARMERMLSWLRAHISCPVNRQDLAREFSLTPEYVNALFKKELGFTPTQFVQRERVMMAYRFIQSEGLSVKQAAARVGFKDRFYFSRVFKRIMGVSPSEVQ